MMAANALKPAQGEKGCSELLLAACFAAAVVLA
jgi:hypothetical protein